MFHSCEKVIFSYTENIVSFCLLTLNFNLNQKINPIYTTHLYQCLFRIHILAICHIFLSIRTFLIPNLCTIFTFTLFCYVYFAFVILYLYTFSSFKTSLNGFSPALILWGCHYIYILGIFNILSPSICMWTNRLKEKPKINLFCLFLTFGMP